MIQLTDVCKSYEQVEVLRDVTVEIQAGERYYILGDSGSGKTTLLRILMGLESVDSGKVIQNEAIKYAVVFQEDRLLEELDVWTNITLVSKYTKKDIQRCLEQVGLGGYERAPIHNLSGGMKRRVAILRAILSDFDILVLDEPMKGLDELCKERVIEQILHYAQGKTVILTVHDQQEAIQMNVTNKIMV